MSTDAVLQVSSSSLLDLECALKAEIQLTNVFGLNRIETQSQDNPGHIDNNAVLPAEILGKIMLIVYYSPTWRTTCMRGMNSPTLNAANWLRPQLAMSHVCRYWRDVAVGLSALWSDLVFDQNVKPLSFLMALMRSKKAEITLELKLPPPPPTGSSNTVLTTHKGFLSVLATASPRITKLHLRIETPPWSEGSVKALLSTWRLSILRRLYIAVSSPEGAPPRPAMRIELPCPRVREVLLGHCYRRSWTSPDLKSVYIAESSITVGELITIMCSVPRLQRLQLHRVSIHGSGDFARAIAHAPEQLSITECRQSYVSIEVLLRSSLARAIPRIRFPGAGDQTMSEVVQLAVFSAVLDVAIEGTMATLVGSSGYVRSFGISSGAFWNDVPNVPSNLLADLRLLDTVTSWTITIRQFWHFYERASTFMSQAGGDVDTTHPFHAATRLTLLFEYHKTPIRERERRLPAIILTSRPWPQLRELYITAEEVSDPYGWDVTPSVMFSNGRPQWTQSPEDFLWLLPSSAIILDFALFTGFGFIHRDSKEMIETELSPKAAAVRFEECIFK